MEKRVIIEGITYMVNRIALSLAPLAHIYRELNHPVLDTLDLSTALAFLQLRTDSTTRRLALSVILSYRHYIAHDNITPPLIRDLNDAVGTISSWYLELISMNKPLMSPVLADELVVELLRLAINSIYKHDMLLQSPPVAAQQPPLTPVSTAFMDDVDNIEITATLRELRTTEWRDKLKRRNILILDGKTMNKRGKFLYWNGTVAYVRFKGEPKPHVIPIDRTVSVYKSKYTTITSNLQ